MVPRMGPPLTQRRKRLLALAAAAATIALGLASRRFADQLPDFVATYAGDTLWALLVYLLATACAPSTTILRRAIGAALLAYAVEASQLYRADWIDAIRDTRLGALVLGSGFLWSDLICYSVGIAIGAATEALGAGIARRCSDA